VKYLTWEEIYSFEKFFPILTRWQLLHQEQIKDETQGIVTPKFIKKRRNPKGTKKIYGVLQGYALGPQFL
jgi:hypothetical protein